MVRARTFFGCFYNFNIRRMAFPFSFAIQFVFIGHFLQISWVPRQHFIAVPGHEDGVRMAVSSDPFHINPRFDGDDHVFGQYVVTSFCDVRTFVVPQSDAVAGAMDCCRPGKDSQYETG